MHVKEKLGIFLSGLGGELKWTYFGLKARRKLR